MQNRGLHDGQADEVDRLQKLYVHNEVNQKIKTTSKKAVRMDDLRNLRVKSALFQRANTKETQMVDAELADLVKYDADSYTQVEMTEDDPQQIAAITVVTGDMK